MAKKLIVAASILGVLALGGSFAVGAALNRQAIADENSKADKGILTELKVGKYYLENGTEDEYLEVYDDGTLQFFGLDYFKMVCELNAERIAGYTEEEYAQFVKGEQDIVDFWNGRNYYKLREMVKTIALDDKLPEPGEPGFHSGYVLEYTDENTILWDDEHIYKFAE